MKNSIKFEKVLKETLTNNEKLGYFFKMNKLKIEIIETGKNSIDLVYADQVYDPSRKLGNSTSQFVNLLGFMQGILNEMNGTFIATSIPMTSHYDETRKFEIKF